MNIANKKKLCEKYKSAFIDIKDNEIIGVALDTLHKEPLYGVRIMPTKDTTGWYLWGGPHSEDPNFYQPVHASHVANLCPLVIDYLALEPGYKFIIDRAGYEDVWREGSIEK